MCFICIRGDGGGSQSQVVVLSCMLMPGGNKRGHATQITKTTHKWPRGNSTLDEDTVKALLKSNKIQCWMKSPDSANEHWDLITQATSEKCFQRFELHPSRTCERIVVFVYIMVSRFWQGLKCNTIWVFITEQWAGSSDSSMMRPASSMLTGPAEARLECRIPSGAGQEIVSGTEGWLVYREAGGLWPVKGGRQVSLLGRSTANRVGNVTDRIPETGAGRSEFWD